MKVPSLCVLGVAACLPSRSQTFAEITGEVKDTAGAIVVGAKVTATNAATGGTRETVTTKAGVYSFSPLIPGIYDLRVEQLGLRAAVHNGVELQVQHTARVDFKLQVGPVSESVELIASAAQPNTEDATVGTVVERITDLPLNGRDFGQINYTRVPMRQLQLSLKMVF
jgi:hypothetical protein